MHALADRATFDSSPAGTRYVWSGITWRCGGQGRSQLRATRAGPGSSCRPLDAHDRDVVVVPAVRPCPRLHFAD